MKSAILTACLVAAAPVLSAAEDSRVHVHGYGEVHSNNDLDVHRAVIGLKAELAANAFYNMEVDFEHGFNEPELEFAYVDWVLSSSLTLRIGDMLMPVGPLNEFHEPPLFLSVERPALSNKLIPTTWQEVGAGVALSFPDQGLAMRAYLVNGLKGDTLRTGGFKNIRATRGKGKGTIKAEDLAGVGRIEYSPLLGLHLGASAYFGGADHSAVDAAQLTVGMYEADVKYRIAGVQLQGQFFLGTVGGGYFDAAGLDGKTAMGYQAEAAYRLMDALGAGSQLAPFVRYENINTDLNTSAAEAGEQVITGGLAFYPNPNLALKVDAEFWMAEKATAYTPKSGVKTDTKTVINAGFGVMF